MTEAHPAPDATETARVGRGPWWTYAWWFSVGALVGLSVLSLLTIGIFLLIAAAALGGIGAKIAAPDRAAITIPAGIAVPVLFVAWLNRAGPGTICHQIPGGRECGDQWSPWPFVAVAIVLVGVSIVFAVVSARRSWTAPL